MSSMSESLDLIAEAISSLNPYANPTVKIKEPKVGMPVGTCLNCGKAVVLRQPWLSRMPSVNDGWYLLHCENGDCHNYYGMKLREKEFSIADFVDWNDEYLIKKSESEVINVGNVIPFKKRNYRYQTGGLR